MKITSEEIAPIIKNINQAQVRAERFWRERVLALILQSNWYSSFIYSPQAVWLRGYKKEKESVSVTLARIENMKFEYNPVRIEVIAKLLLTLQPASQCRQLWYVRIANGIAAIWCGDNWSLLDFFCKTYGISKWPESSWQDSFLESRNLWPISKTDFSWLLYKRWIDPNITRAEVIYFKEFIEKSKITKQ